MPDRIRFGIFGTGTAAARFAEACAVLQDELVLQAVASRSRDRADAFAKRWGVAQAYDSYETLSLSKDVDIVYIATPHNFHLENMRLATQNGRHCLCEKPVGISRWEADQMRLFSGRSLVFLMEANWTLFMPAYRKLLDLFRTGAIGRPTFLRAEQGVNPPPERFQRLTDPGLAGGALLALGVHNLLIAGDLFGFDAELVHVGWAAAESGVDLFDALTLRHAGGQTSSLLSSLCSRPADEVVVAGDRGVLTLRDGGTRLILDAQGRQPEEYHFPHRANGMEYGIRHACGCLRDGKLESDIATFGQSESVMRLCDAVRREICLIYPFE